MKRMLLLIVPVVLCVLLFSDALAAFCGFYVARADARLFNRASQVVLVRDGIGLLSVRIKHAHGFNARHFGEMLNVMLAQMSDADNA